MKLEILLIESKKGRFLRCMESGDKGLHFVEDVPDNPYDWPQYNAYLIEKQAEYQPYMPVIDLDTNEFMLLGGEDNVPKNYARIFETTNKKLDFVDNMSKWLIDLIVEHNGHTINYNFEFNPLQ